jgi:hypothetical protein
MDKRAEHVQQHAFAAIGDDFKNLHVDQCGEHNGAGSIHSGCMVDLPYCLVCLVDGINEGKTDVTGFGFELGQDGISKRFGGDACAVGDKKD